MPDHSFILLHHPDQGPIEIDEEIAPIISHLWHEGIDTCYCCQGDKHQQAYIIFPGSEAACRFLNRYERALMHPDWFPEGIFVLSTESATKIRENGQWRIQISVEWQHELTPDLVDFATDCMRCDCICHVTLGRPGVIHDHLIDKCEHCQMESPHQGS